MFSDKLFEVSGGRILLVDDSPENLQILKVILEKHGYQAFGALSGTLALESMARVRPDLILLDIMMPGMNGYDVCAQLKSQLETRDIPVLFISALHEPVDKLMAFNAGAVDYISKPFQAEEVLARVKTHLALYRMTSNLENMVVARVEELVQIKSRYDRLEESLAQTIEAITLAIETRVPLVAAHLLRVTNLAVAIAKQMGLRRHVVDGIRVSAMLHDIGNLHQSEVSDKDVKCHDKLARSHAEAGYVMLKKISFPWPVAEIVFQHHEFMDGSGYPRGLKGDDILLEARVICVANKVEELCQRQPNAGLFDVDQVLADLIKNKDVYYDSQVVDACLSLCREHGLKKIFLAG